MQTCSAKTKTGVPCRAPAGANGFCFFHGNPDRAHLLGQIGGKRNRRTPVVDLEVPDNMTANDLRNLTGKAIRALLLGELTTRKAGALAQLCNSMHRMIPAADLEDRVAKLEQQLEERSSPTAAQTVSVKPCGENQLRGTNAQQGDETPLDLEREPDQSDASPEKGGS
jgi:hypothetical protein